MENYNRKCAIPSQRQEQAGCEDDYDAKVDWLRLCTSHGTKKLSHSSFFQPLCSVIVQVFMDGTTLPQGSDTYCMPDFKESRLQPAHPKAMKQYNFEQVIKRKHDRKRRNDADAEKLRRVNKRRRRHSKLSV